jgi:serine/threonine protein phosphatase PrpC
LFSTLAPHIQIPANFEATLAILLCEANKGIQCKQWLVGGGAIHCCGAAELSTWSQDAAVAIQCNVSSHNDVFYWVRAGNMSDGETGRPASAPLRFCTVGLTHQGYRRASNEDNFLVAENRSLWAVADGLGGHTDGEYASAVAVTSVMQSVRAGSSLVRALETAHRDILSAADNGFGRQGMGSTIVALQFLENQFHVAWVGDCRAYLWDGTLSRLTRDHTLGEAMIERHQGRIDGLGEVRNRKQLYKSLGSPLEKKVEVDSIARPWQRGDAILLCSDGLTDELTDATIANVFQEQLSVEQTGAVLLQSALASGGRDNITLILVFPPLGV